MISSLKLLSNNSSLRNVLSLNNGKNVFKCLLNNNKMGTIKNLSYISSNKKVMNNNINRLFSSSVSDYEDDGLYSGTIAQVTKSAPNFSANAVVNNQFKKITLSDYKGKWVYLFFYPLDFTFVCPTEIISFSERSAEFRKLNCEVIGASVDSEYSHLAWINTPRKQGGLGNMNIPLISDITKSISADYGVLLPEQGISLRGSFLIDPQGILRQSTINDLPVGRSVDEALRILQAFQYTDKHGEVCPANWKPGSATMKPDPEGQ